MDLKIHTPTNTIISLSMTFSNIHGQCGYFSKDKTNSSLQLFITWTRDMPRDAGMERKMYTAKKEIAS